MRLGTAVKEARKMAGKTLRELAEACGGLSIGFVSDIEHGRRRASADILRKMEIVLGIKDNTLVNAAEQEISTKMKFKELFENRPQASLALLRLAEDLSDGELDDLLKTYLNKEGAKDASVRA